MMASEPGSLGVQRERRVEAPGASTGTRGGAPLGRLGDAWILNGAVWRQAWGDQRLLWLALAALWGAFPWIYFWLQSQVPMGDFQMLPRLIPEDWQKLSGVTLTEVATHAGITDCP